MSINDNSHLYATHRQYADMSGPYECLWKHWWIKSAAHSVYEPRKKCELQVLNCGEDVFKAIARDVGAARKTVDIITWGFDPGMFLTRSGSAGECIRYGDLIKKVATRKENSVIVRILVWHDDIFSHLTMKNIPSYYGGRFPTIGVCAGYFGEDHENYNAQWFDEVMEGKYPNIRFHVRDVPLKHKDGALSDEKYDIGFDGWCGSLYPSHHQKMVLIDYELPKHAVGYVMGHNSITDFWDTAKHTFQDPLRETFYKKNPKDMQSNLDPVLDQIGYYLSGRNFMEPLSTSGRAQEKMRNFVSANAFTAKPYQDVSMRVRGPILFDMNLNFCEGWAESGFIKSRVRHAVSVAKTIMVPTPVSKNALNFLSRNMDVGKELEGMVYKEPDPEFIKRRKSLNASLFALEGGKHSAQLLRTQPMHKEKGIKECYANMVRQMENYIFLQNQYIQYEEWIHHLKKCAERLRSDGYMKAINVFILTSTPESNGMDLPTYAVAKELGQSKSMVYEHREAMDLAKQKRSPPPISPEELSKSGINVVMGSMWTCAKNPKYISDYEEIYIHAKVAIVDDVAFTIGSANLNVRSMALDSELNVFSQAMDVATELRKRLFLQCTESEGPAQFSYMSATLDKWQILAEDNLRAMNDFSPLKGQLVAFHVNRKPASPVM
jgi:phosphatidylserine/phosphatidylglycerophosphate/cardiolipin synthase-like enzyme